MKKMGYLQLAGIFLLSHFAQCAANVLLFAAAAYGANFTFASGTGYAVGALLAVGLPLLLGWGFRPEGGADKNRCWNVAMVLYVLNLASLVVHPSSSLSVSGSGAVAATVWELPMLPALAGAEALLDGALFYVALTLLAAVEPLCLTLGLTRKGKPPVSAEQNENSAASSASAGAAIINEENNTNA